MPGRDTCHVPRAGRVGDTGHWSWGCAGAARGQFVQITPGSATSLLGKCGCVCVLGDFITETKGGTTFEHLNKLQSFSNTPMSSSSC